MVIQFASRLCPHIEAAQYLTDAPTQEALWANNDSIYLYVASSGHSEKRYLAETAPIIESNLVMQEPA